MCVYYIFCVLKGKNLKILERIKKISECIIMLNFIKNSLSLLLKHRLWFNIPCKAFLHSSLKILCIVDLVVKYSD